MVLIGTSPLMMLQALHQHHAGRRVLVLDRARQHGGAWYTKDVWSYQSLEMGSHVVRNRRAAYRFLEDVLDIELSPPHGLEFGFVAGRRVKLPTYRLKNALRSLWTDLRGLRLGEAWSGLPGALRVAAHARMPFQYPLAGCVSIVRRLAQMLDASGIEVQLGAEVEEIEIQPDRQGGICHTRDGPIGFRQIVIGQNAHAPTRVGAEPVAFTARSKVTTNVLLHLRGHRRHDFSYFELRGDRLLRRVRNIGVYLKPPVEEPEMVVVAHLNRARYERFPSDEACAAAVLERFVALQVVEPDTALVEFGFDHLEQRKIELDELERLGAALAPALIAMPTWDLGEELTSMLRRGGLVVPRAGDLLGNRA